jgi:hypothetical protein
MPPKRPITHVQITVPPCTCGRVAAIGAHRAELDHCQIQE